MLIINANNNSIGFQSRSERKRNENEYYHPASVRSPKKKIPKVMSLITKGKTKNEKKNEDSFWKRKIIIRLENQDMREQKMEEEIAMKFHWM